MFDNLEQFSSILVPFLSNENLQGESLICLSNLSLQALKDHPNKKDIYTLKFQGIFYNCVQQISNLDRIIDYEIMEGSLTFVYFFIELFKNEAYPVVPIDIFWKWLDYVNDVNTQQEFNEDDEEDFEE